MNNIETFALLLEAEQLENLRQRGLNCENNILARKVKIVDGNKYIKVNVGTSGKYMVEKSTGIIFGIKGYGQVHKGHKYGTLDTINEWNWGTYYPVKKDEPQFAIWGQNHRECEPAKEIIK
jgi:hypothetical protein